LPKFRSGTLFHECGNIVDHTLYRIAWRYRLRTRCNLHRSVPCRHHFNQRSSSTLFIHSHSIGTFRRRMLLRDNARKSNYLDSDLTTRNYLPDVSSRYRGRHARRPVRLRCRSAVAHSQVAGEAKRCALAVSGTVTYSRSSRTSTTAGRLVADVRRSHAGEAPRPAFLKDDGRKWSTSKVKQVDEHLVRTREMAMSTGKSLLSSALRERLSCRTSPVDRRPRARHRGDDVAACPTRPACST